MTPTNPAVLTLIGDPELFESADRVAAAVGARSYRVATPPTRKVWLAAAAVVLDENAAGSCCGHGLPRRDGVFLVMSEHPSTSTWVTAMTVGAQQVWVLPDQESELVRCLSEATEGARGGSASGCVVAVTAGRGGAGASVFAVALAHGAAEPLLVDLDPWAGGIDLLLGGESAPGLRWPDLRLQAGRLTWASLRDALPRHRGVSVLSGTRRCHEIGADPVEAVLDAGRRGGATVICDVPRRMTGVETSAFECADLVVVVTTCDVRGVAATGALTPALRAVNPNLGLVVRGPSPGGLRPADAADLAAAPLLASMRPEPMLAERLERGGLRLRRRSPLATAARRVLAVLPRGQGRAA